MTRKTSPYARKRARKLCRVDPQASARLISACQTFEAGELTEQHNVTSAALERLRTGCGTVQDFDRVGMALNMGMVLAEPISPDLVRVMQEGQAGMVRMQDRYRRGMALGFDSVGLLAVVAALHAYEDIADQSSTQLIAHAVREAYRRSTGGQTLTIDWAQGVAA